MIPTLCRAARRLLSFGRMLAPSSDSQLFSESCNQPSPRSHYLCQCEPNTGRGVSPVKTRMDGAVLGKISALFNLGVIRELTDGQLLERFSTDRSETAELAFA